MLTVREDEDKDAIPWRSCGADRIDAEGAATWTPGAGGAEADGATLLVEGVRDDENWDTSPSSSSVKSSRSTAGACGAKAD